MNRAITGLAPEFTDYINAQLPPEHPVLAALRQRTSTLEMAGMQISREQAQHMQLLLRLLGAHRTLEIGVFTGYSTLATALALPEDGQVLACDLNAEWTDIAEAHWTRAGVAHKIDLRLAPALQTLQELLDTGQTGSFDFAFIDADKLNYLEYYQACVKLVRRGGLIAVDNALWGGKVLDEGVRDADTQAIRAVNQFIASDTRVMNYLCASGDGLHLAQVL